MGWTPGHTGGLPYAGPGYLACSYPRLAALYAGYRTSVVPTDADRIRLEP
jgi:hypothetical protein